MPTSASTSPLDDPRVRLMMGDNEHVQPTPVSSLLSAFKRARCVALR